MNFPLIPLPGFLSGIGFLEEIHRTTAELFIVMGSGVGLTRLIINACRPEGFDRKNARIGFCLLGVAIAGATFGANIILAVIACIVFVIVLICAYWFFWIILVKNAIAAFSPKKEKQEDVGPGPD